MRSRNKKGVREEKGEIIDLEYTGPVLERVLKENRVIHTNLLKEDNHVSNYSKQTFFGKESLTPLAKF